MINLSDTEFDTATVQHYISVVVNKIQVLLQKVGEISQLDYASPSPVTLSEILIRILSRFFDHLRTLSKKAEYQPPGDTIRAVYTINHIVVSIIPHLIEAIERSDHDAPTASIIEAYESIGNKIQYGVQTIIHSTWEYNASSNEVMRYLRKVTSSLSQDASNAIFSGAPQYFLIITYPKAEEPIILRQALIAHEVGHFIDESIKGWSKSLLERQLLDPTAIDNVISEVSKEEYPDELQSRIVQLIDKMVSHWVKEIVSDFLAISMIGPAYLFAFDEISFSPKYSLPQKLSLSHPPDQLRKAIMAEWVSKMYLQPVLNLDTFDVLSPAGAELFEKIVQRVAIVSRGDDALIDHTDKGTPLSGDLLVLVYSALRNAMEHAARLLWEENYASIENEQWICRTIDIIDAIRLQDLILHGLIPTELYATPSRSPSFAAVMNSGWFHFVGFEDNYLYFSERINQVSNPDQITAKYLNLQDLISKAIESLHFKSEFDRRKGSSRDTA